MSRFGANIKLSLLRESVWYNWGSFVGNLTKKTTFLAIYFYRPPTKVMFSQVSLCHSVHRGRWVCLVPDPLWGVGWLVCQEHSPWKVRHQKVHPQKVHLKCWHLVVATEAGGMDPTGMLSCKCRWSCKKYGFNWGGGGGEFSYRPKFWLYKLPSKLFGGKPVATRRNGFLHMQLLSFISWNGKKERNNNAVE